jgi:hypothetical protein
MFGGMIPLSQRRLAVCLALALCPAAFAQPDEDLPPQKSQTPEATQENQDPAAQPPAKDYSGSFVDSTKDKRPAWIQPGQPYGVDWKGLFLSSGFLLGVQHAFRFYTEPGTREGMKGPYLKGYLGAVENLHGWSDGDETYVNYLGHPMQGAVTGFIWINNDRSYRQAEFGFNRLYLKRQVRALAFSYAYSVQFEIGPLSEASMGKVQALYPQQGFVDHVITPVLGTVWVSAEDAIDKYVIMFIERKVPNSYVRLFARGLLNPARSFGNAMTWRVPWSRNDRPGVFSHSLTPYLEAEKEGLITIPKPPKVVLKGEFGLSPFEVTANFNDTYFSGKLGSCPGGSGETAFRVHPSWQMILTAGGCTVRNLETNLTGDTLSYMVGSRWTPRATARWSPYLQVLVGGMKISEERLYPDLKAAVFEQAKQDGWKIDPRVDPVEHAKYTTEYAWNRFSMSAGGGIDLRLSPAIAWRLAALEYKHTWSPPMNGNSFNNALVFSTGAVLRFGTW